MMKLMKMPEAQATFGRFAASSHIYAPPSAEADLFIGADKEDINTLLTGSPLFLGQAGSGKSGGVGRCAEQILAQNLTILIADITGEHEGIVQMFADRFERITRLDKPEEDAARYCNGDKCFYYDMSAFSRGEYLKYFDAFLKAAHDVKVEIYKQNTDKVRMQIFIFEEAQNLVPESAPAADKETVAALFRVREHIKWCGTQGRKYGYCIWLITQRPSMCAKDIISQSRVRFMLKVFEKNDVDVYATMLAGSKRSELLQTLNSMKPGECFFVADGKISMRRFKRKKSKDMGQTPGFAQTVGWKAAVKVE